MNPYDIGSFIERVKDKDYEELMIEAQREVYSAERGTSGVKGAVRKREMGALEYAANIKGLIFFLSSGIKPNGVNDYIFLLFKPVCQNLVDKKKFNPKILNIFDTISEDLE